MNFIKLRNKDDGSPILLNMDIIAYCRKVMVIEGHEAEVVTKGGASFYVSDSYEYIMGMVDRAALYR